MMNEGEAERKLELEKTEWGSERLKECAGGGEFLLNLFSKWNTPVRITS